MRVPRRRRFLLAASLAALAASGAPTPSRADPVEDREALLARVGVPDDLRPRIHRAIDIGALWLARHVARDGTYRFDGPKSPACDDGVGALATLAIAHARQPVAAVAGRLAARRLFDVPEPGAKAPDPARGATVFTAAASRTYTAGLLALIAADETMEIPRGAARELSVRLARGQRSGGWWGYVLRDGATISTLRGGGAPAAAEGAVNLSTTQFAALGAHALGRVGAPVPLEVWRRHADGLCDAQTDDGSWPYAFGRASHAGYRNGTFMGLASLLLAQAALTAAPGNPALERRIDAAVARGTSALRREVGEVLRGLASAPSREASIARDGYGLYALEKACLFAGLEEVDGRSWYVPLARALVERQGDDGDFDQDPVGTSFAVLFLARSPARDAPTTAPTTATEPARPPRPTTPATPAAPARPTGQDGLEAPRAPAERPTPSR